MRAVKQGHDYIATVAVRTRLLDFSREVLIEDERQDMFPKLQTVDTFC